MNTTGKKTTHSRRNAALAALMAAPYMAVAQAAKPMGEFVLFFNQDPVCANFTRNLNQFRHLEYDACHPRLSPKYPEFSRPQWREVPLDVGIAEKTISKFNWQRWQAEIKPFLERKEIKMWMTDVDVNHDGELDAVARVERSANAREEPFAKRDCVYSSAGLWFMAEPKVPLWVGNHFSFDRYTDLIHSSATQRTYAVEWGEVPLDITWGRETFPAPKGATRSVTVGLSDEVKDSRPYDVCGIAWVPTGAISHLTPDQRWKRDR